MMFLTLGISWTPRCTAWLVTLVTMFTETLSTPGTVLGGRHQRLAQRRRLALGRIAQLDVERDLALVDLQVLQRLGADEILACVGVEDGLEGLRERLLRNCH